MDIKKPIPETFLDLKRMGYTWYIPVEDNQYEWVEHFSNLIPENVR